MSNGIAPSAVIEAGARVGDGSLVWDHSQIRTGASVGSNCIVGRNVYIDRDVVIGDRCKVQNNALIYAPARLGDGVFIGPAVVLTNDRYPRAVTPDGRLLESGEWVASPVTIGNGASIGAGALVVAGVTIGDWALVGAGSVVTDDVSAHALMVGSPARRIGWVGRTGTRLRPDDGQPSLLVCPATGQCYRDHGDWVEPE